jgi:UDP-N-acetylmuramyl pentapeptide phosphotransferase/UDP-N-acetylglucosamine-1-phosphate transferase
MALSNIIFLVSIILFALLFNKYLLFFFKKINTNLLVDDQFSKPQAFHKNPIPRLGGIALYCLLAIIFTYLFFSKNIFYFEYISFCSLFFILGLIDDLKINIAPKFRLIAMIVFLIILIASSNIYINRTGLAFLDNLIEIDIFSLIFICLCFLFIINGSNLIDGFNGLLGIHSLVIFITLLIVNFTHDNNSISFILFYISLFIIIFIKFNFPKAQIFLGDSGAYLIGSLIAITTIQTSNLNPSISPFFFCILVFYLFFEVFFSFFRKILISKKTPLLPDNKHLHMLLYKMLFNKYKKNLNSNYMVSIYINLIYFLLILPGIYFMEDGLFCRYYFFSLIIFYIYFYKTLYKKTK